MTATSAAATRTIAGGAPLERLLRAAGAEPSHATGRVWAFGPGDRANTARTALGDAVPDDRILVIGWIGTHPDANAAVLRSLWELEEACRASRARTLVLRLGPLVGPSTPLCAQLVQSDPPARPGRVPMHPVAERDVVETLRRAWVGTIAWEGWYELGGPEALTLAELGAIVRTGAAAEPAVAAAPIAAWEPDLGALAEQRLIEPEVWTAWSGVAPRTMADEVASWRA